MKRVLPATLLVSLALAACADTPTAVRTPEQSAPESLQRPARVGTHVDYDATAAPELDVSMHHGSGSLATQQLGVGGLAPGNLAQTLIGIGSGVTITGVSYTGIAHAAGLFHGGTGIIGFENGIVLSTGDIFSVRGPNNLNDVSTGNNRPGDAGLNGIAGVQTYDASILNITFIPNGDHVAFEYVFASDEYPEWVGESYNDPFAFYVNGQNCAKVGNSNLPVTINNVNAQTNSSFFRINRGTGSLNLNTQMDGLTVVLVCQAAVNAGQPNTLRLAIADAGDDIYDSNVFIKAGSFSTTVPGQIALSPATATQPENPTAAHTVTAQVRFANGAPQANVTVSFEVISGPNAGATGTGVTDGLGQATFKWVDANGDGTDVVQASYFDGVDGEDKTTTAEMVWSVVNEAPAADAGPGLTGTEGSAINFDGSASSDADGDALTYSWDFGDGSTGTGVAPSHTYADNGSYTVTLVVNDGTEDSAPSTASVEIANVVPVVTMPAGASIDEAGTFSGSGSFADPGADAWTATVDYGDGTGAQPLALAGSTFGLSHTYADNGTYTVTVTVTETDVEAGSGQATTQVAVANVAPTVSAGGDVTVVSGQSFVLSGSFTDPGVNDAPWQWTIDFDGSTAAGSGTPGGAITVPSHTYLAAGTYDVVLTVTDKDGGAGQDGLTVTVTRVAVGIDIKPGSLPNSINLGNGNGKSGSSSGSVPVAVLGSATLDAAQIDVASITLGDLSGTDTPVAVKNNGSFQAALEDVNQDGKLDLVLHFSRAALIANGDITSATTSLTLLGDMQNGQQFQGSDSVNIVP